LIKGYAIVNVVTRIPALDFERCFLLDQNDSVIDPLTGRPDVTGIGKIALKANALKGHDLIRLLEFFPPVLVSQRFAEVFRIGKFTGATLNQLLTS